MRIFPALVAIATLSAALGFHVNPAAAQNFEDRWSIIPKAHAEPAPAPPDQTKQEPQAQPPGSDPPIQGLENSNTGPRVFSGKASFYSYRTGKTASGSSFDRDLQIVAGALADDTLHLGDLAQRVQHYRLVRPGVRRLAAREHVVEVGQGLVQRAAVRAWA